MQKSLTADLGVISDADTTDGIVSFSSNFTRTPGAMAKQHTGKIISPAHLVPWLNNTQVTYTSPAHLVPWINNTQVR